MLATLSSCLVAAEHVLCLACPLIILALRVIISDHCVFVTLCVCVCVCVVQRSCQRPPRNSS